MQIEFEHYKFLCSRCVGEFLQEIRNKEYNVEVVCPYCGNVIKEKEQVQKLA